MNIKEIIKRYILFIISLFFIALGIAFTKHAGLGVSTISSVANVLSCRYTNISIGEWLVVTNCVLIVGQIVLYRKNFPLIQLMQLPLSFAFGYFTDISMMFVSYLPVSTYMIKLVLVVLGVVILALGICMGIIANVILNAGEGIVKAISDVTKKEFAHIKVVFDVLWVGLAVIMSLFMFNGKLVGVGVGTLISAFLTGWFVKLWKNILNKPLNKFIN